MIGKMKNLNVVFLCVLCVNFCKCQDYSDATTEYLIDEISTEFNRENNTEYSDNTTDICKLCYCAMDVLFDCTNRGIEYLTHDFEDIPNHPNIDVLNLSYNNLVNLTRFPEVSLTIVNISHGNLEHIEAGSFELINNLLSLDLSYNKLSTNSIHREVFTNRYQSLETLDLSHNDIHSLKQDVFEYVPLLKRLYLSGNPLILIDQITMAAITFLEKITDLGLRDCQLETLPEGFLRRHRCLERLDLAENKFTIVPSVIAESVNLVILHLDNNPIQTLEDDTRFSKLTNLIELHMSNMSRLEKIGAGALGGLKSLQILNLSFNIRLNFLSPDALMWTDEYVSKWPTLTKLYLNNNNLTEINAHLLEDWNKLQVVDVAYNPFRCDCRNRWTVKVLVTLMKNLPGSDIANMVCFQPPEVRGLSLKFLNDMHKELECRNRTKENLKDDRGDEDRNPSHSSVILGVVIGVILTFPLVFIVVLMWLKGFFKTIRKGCYEVNGDEVVKCKGSLGIDGEMT